MRMIASACLMVATVGTAAAQTPPEFEGRFIAAISDADMRAYAYIDGALGEPRGTDALTIVELPLSAEVNAAVLEVSNSVINPVFSIDAAPNGETIFVAETRLPRDADDTTIGDLGVGTTLRAVSVSDPAAPAIIDMVEVGTEPQGVSISPDGRTLVLATKTPRTPLTFVSFADGTFGESIQFALPDLSPMTELADQGLLPHHAEWHPTEDIVAVTFNFRGQVRFYEVTRDEAGRVSAIAQWGNAVQTSKWPMSGKFSADGRFFVTNDLQWGADVRGFYINAPGSQLTSIELADMDTATPRHFVVGGAALPRHAESFAFSNAGDLIATVNIGQTWIPEGETGYSQSSLSLLSFDPSTGQFAHLESVFFDAILPEGVDFDASDRFIVVGAFEYEVPEPRPGALEFWEIVEDGETPSLADTGYRIQTGPGAHSLVVVDD